MVEGLLALDRSTGRYSIADCELTSGTRLQLYINGHWLAGHMEYVDTIGYVFMYDEGSFIPLYCLGRCL